MTRLARRTAQLPRRRIAMMKLINTALLMFTQELVSCQAGVASFASVAVTNLWEAWARPATFAPGDERTPTVPETW